jgi:hypothetical protein
MGLRSFAKTFGLEQRFPAATEKDHDDGDNIEHESQSEPRKSTKALLNCDIGCDGAANEASYNKEADIEHPRAVRRPVGSRRRNEPCARLDPFRKGLRIGHEPLKASVAVHVVAASLPGDAEFTTFDRISIHWTAERCRQRPFVRRKSYRCLDGGRDEWSDRCD